MNATLWFNPAVGVAGDMLLGALLDVGAPQDAVRQQLERLSVAGWVLEVGEVRRRGLRATRALVRFEEGPHHRPWSTIDRLLADAGLEPAVEAGARATFRLLAEAEAAVHGIDVEEVHFHEVGAVDALVDIVGTWAARAALPVERVVSAPVGLGAGAVTAAHGVLPAPAPATLRLLTGHPTRPLDTPLETATPTGVALLVALVDGWGPLPAGRITHSGFGAGGRDPDTHPNLLGAVLTVDDGARRTDAVIVETNLDDVAPEVLGLVIDRALELGADDAWVAPITMKKSRPAHQLRVLCAPALEAAVVALVAAETGTLGLRTLPVTKHVLPRHFVTVEVAGRPIDVKVGPHGAKPEHDDVVSVATSLGRTVRSVAAEAMSAYWNTNRGGNHPEQRPDSP